MRNLGGSLFKLGKLCGSNVSAATTGCALTCARSDSYRGAMGIIAGDDEQGMMRRSFGKSFIEGAIHSPMHTVPARRIDRRFPAGLTPRFSRILRRRRRRSASARFLSSRIRGISFHRFPQRSSCASTARISRRMTCRCIRKSASKILQPVILCKSAGGCTRAI